MDDSAAARVIWTDRTDFKRREEGHRQVGIVEAIRDAKGLVKKAGRLFRWSHLRPEGK